MYLNMLKVLKLFLTLDKGNLQTHMKRHNGVKEYKCKYCLKDYIQKSHLVNHIEKFHKKAFEDDDNIYGLSL